MALVRKSDPRTSVEAARQAAKASLKALQAVEALMSDGVARIDEEIWMGCRQNGFISSLSTIQHGRLALSSSGVLKETGIDRPTSLGTKSREWIIVPVSERVDAAPVVTRCPTCGHVSVGSP